jgi:hypothetical protein
MEYQAAEYKGKRVTLNKPFRTQGGKKKFAVYVQKPGGRVVIVRFGDPNMEIKRDDPKRRRAFRDRHNCAEKKDRTTPGYWSCQQWRKSAPVQGEELDMLNDESWELNEAQAIFEDIEEVIEAEEACGEDKDDCGCGCTESVEAANPDAPKEDEYKAARDVYDSPDEAMKRAKEMGCDEVHSHTEGGKTVFMPCKTHAEYKKKNGGVDVEGYKKEKKASCDNECGLGEELIGGVCVAVTTELTIESVETVLEASTGKSMIMISGVAFHEGMNKNSWEITKAGAEKLLPQMIGADITLNHPKATNGRFRRNMTGLDEGVVGRITSATMEDKEGDSWEVRFTGSVERSELFEVLESGLWLREGYGVSIGGTGVPDRLVEAADGRQGMVFESDFTFDHLAIVHKPAYSRAVIDEAVRVESTAPSASESTPHLDISAENEETFIPSSPQSEDYGTGMQMTDEEIIEPVAEEVVASEDLSGRMAEMEKALVLANSRVAEFENAEAARIENARLELVASATEMGLKGHESLPSETITELIASRAASKPVAR